MEQILGGDKELKKIGLKFNPFNSKPLNEDEINLMVGRDNELNTLSRIIGERKNILITGKKGIGKTTILNGLYGQAKKEKITVARLKAPPPSVRRFFIQIFKSLLIENKTTKNFDLEKYEDKLEKYEDIPVMYASHEIIEDIKTVSKYFKRVDYPLLVFIDEFHKIMLSPGMRNIDLIVDLCDVMFDNDFVFVCASLIRGIRTNYENPSKEALMERFSPPITLTPLSLEDTKQQINKRIQSAKSKNSNFLFEDKVIEKIYDYSETPRETNDLCDQLLNHHLKGNPLNEESVKYVAKQLYLTPMMRLKEDLKPRQKKIFNCLLETNKPISPTDAASIVHMPPSTVVYNLKDMEDNILVTHVGKGSHVKYLVRDNGKEAIPKKIDAYTTDPVSGAVTPGVFIPKNGQELKVNVDPKKIKVYETSTVVPNTEPTSSSHHETKTEAVTVVPNVEPSSSHQETITEEKKKEGENKK